MVNDKQLAGIADPDDLRDWAQALKPSDTDADSGQWLMVNDKQLTGIADPDDLRDWAQGFKPSERRHELIAAH